MIAWAPLSIRSLAALNRLKMLLPLLTRLLIGWLFLESGIGKLDNQSEVVQFLTMAKLPQPILLAGLSAGTEFICGICLLLGLLTRVATLPMLVLLTTALYTVRWPEIEGVSDFFSAPEVLLMALILWILTHGPGPISLDHLFFRKGGKGGDNKIIP